MATAAVRSDRGVRSAVSRWADLAKMGAAMVGLRTGVERLLHERAPEDFPRVSTRGHFDVRRSDWPAVVGRVVENTGYGRVQLTSGHTMDDYDTVGTIPGLDTAAEPSELLVFVHGWFAGETVGLARFSKMAYELEKAGYEPPVIGFSWDATFGWGATFDVADRNGPKLARFLADYARACPDTDVRLLSNSIAARIVLEAAWSLDRAGETDAVTSASLLLGAVDSRSVARSGRYGHAIASAVGTLHNYWHRDDQALNTVYRAVEGEPALGGTGAVGEPPRNYVDHNVDEVPDHLSVYRSDVGCIPRVVEDFSR